VVAAVEVAVDQLVGDAVVGAGVQHQAAEHGLLGFDRLRRHAQLLDAVVAAERRIGTQSLACAHQRRDSPVRTVVAVLFL
jgi:hypothetical protein